MPSHHQSPHGRIKDLPDYSYDDVDYGTMLDVAKGRRFKGWHNIMPMQMVQPWTDADGNPVEPDKMQIHPLRARRDYGGSSMNEGKIAAKIVATTWNEPIDKLISRIIGSATEIGKIDDETQSEFMSLHSLKEYIIDGSYPMMPMDERKQQEKIIDDTQRKLYTGMRLMREAKKIMAKAGMAFIQASKSAEGIK